MPRRRRKSQMAWAIAAMWASVNEPVRGEPRWPLVPKLTSCAGSTGSGTRWWYSRTRRPGSTSISGGAGWPASGETITASMVMPAIEAARGRPGQGVAFAFLVSPRGSSSYPPPACRTVG